MMIQAYDTLINFLSKLGTKADKSTAARYAMLSQLDQSQLELAYRTDWIARKVIDVPAGDSTRAWRAWQAKDTDITSIEDVEKAFKVQQKVKEVLTKARLYGGAAIVIGTNDGDLSQPLDVNKLKKESLKFVHVVTRHEVQTGPIIQNIMDPEYGKPEYYARNSAGETLSVEVRIHPSRVCVFKGAELPSTMLTISGTDAAWGDSILQIVDDACKAAGLVIQSAATMVQEANFDILRIPGLTSQITTVEYEQRILKRMAFANSAKSVVNAIIMDKEEEWERINANFAQLPELLRVYLMIASGAADIPATRFVGQSPVGMNATGDADTRNYYDRISSDQNTVLRPALNTLDEVLIRTALGNRPPNIWYDWNPLWQLDAQTKSNTDKANTESWKADVDSGMFNEDLMRAARDAQISQSGVYPGWDELVDEFGLEPDVEAAPTPEELAAQAAALALGGPPKPANQNNQPPASETLDPNNPGEAPPVRQRKAVGDALFEENRKRAADAMRALHHPGYAVGRVPKYARGAGKWISTAKGKLGLEMSPHETDEDAKAYRLHAKDMAPLPLYVHRDVLNADAILAHYKKQIPEHQWEIPQELHVTIIYCLSPVDWLKAGSDSWSGDEKGRMTIPPGGPRVHEAFDGNALVLSFVSSSLSWRHEDIKWRTEATVSYPNYQPHITIGEVGSLTPDEIRELEPWTGAIELGPEIFKDPNPDYAMAAE